MRAGVERVLLSDWLSGSDDRDRHPRPDEHCQLLATAQVMLSSSLLQTAAHSVAGRVELLALQHGIEDAEKGAVLVPLLAAPRRQAVLGARLLQSCITFARARVVDGIPIVRLCFAL